jgi:hypothetical protein
VYKPRNKYLLGERLYNVFDYVVPVKFVASNFLIICNLYAINPFSNEHTPSRELIINFWNANVCLAEILETLVSQFGIFSLNSKIDFFLQVSLNWLSKLKHWKVERLF